jgi:hypothetical protein
MRIQERIISSPLPLAMLIVAIVALLFRPAEAKPMRVATIDGKRMEALWAELEKDEADASRALLKLADMQKEATAFLGQKLRPLKIDAEQVTVLLDQLGSDNEAVWKKASTELEYFDPRLAINLETLMKTVTEAPARQRMVEILSGRKAESLAGQEVNLTNLGQDKGYNFFANKGSWWADHKVDRINSTGWGNTRSMWTQCVRAIILLEHLSTPEAIAILERMSQGHPEAQPTRIAKESLKRSARDK